MRKIVVYLLFLLNLFIILFFWWQGSGALFDGNKANILLALGRLSGLLAVYFVLLQFVMRGRAVWIEEAFGLNNLATAHRLNGYLSLFFILVHPLFIISAYALVTNVSFFQEVIFLTGDIFFLFAATAVALFLGIVGTSVYLVKSKLKYEWWYGIHLLTYIAVVLAFFHQVLSGSDLLANPFFLYYWYGLYLFVFGNLFIFRFLRQGMLFMKYRFIVERVVPEADNALSVYITGKNLSRFSISPGQFVILRFLDKKRWLQAHPFSLSQMPKDNCLRLTIKNVGDFTSDIGTLAIGTPVLIDGPLGTFTAKAAAKDKFLFIAGGVGITPIRALLEELGAQGKSMVLLYSNKTTNIIFKQELDALVKQYRFALYYIVTEDASFTGETGRIDAEKIKRLVPDFLTRDIYLCGPPPMMGALVHTFRTLGVKKTALHYEKFSL